MRRCVLLLAVLFGIVCGTAWGTAWADEFRLPGLEADSDAYANSLTAHFPAGGTPQARRQAEQAAAAAIRKQDWAAAAAAWETRIGLGDASPAQWMALAEAEMRRTPPEATRALQAAWQNFTRSDAGPPEVPALLVMADALKALDRPSQAIQALEAAAERAPVTQRSARRWTRHGAPPAFWCAASPPSPRPSRRAPASTSPWPRRGATISTPRTGSGSIRPSRVRP